MKKLALERRFILERVVVDSKYLKMHELSSVI